MLPAYYISSADSSFVTYGANGFTRVAFTSSQSTPALVNMPGAAYASGVPGEVVPTPEPSTVVSLMTGIAGLLGLHRSRRRR